MKSDAGPHAPGQVEPAANERRRGRREPFATEHAREPVEIFGKARLSAIGDVERFPGSALLEREKDGVDEIVDMDVVHRPAPSIDEKKEPLSHELEGAQYPRSRSRAV